MTQGNFNIPQGKPVKRQTSPSESSSEGPMPVRTTSRMSIGSQSGRLNRNSSESLKMTVNQHADLHEKEAAAGHHHHHHHHKAPSIVSACISGFVNYLLMFGLCCAYGMIMFTDDFNGQHRALGVKLNLLTSFMAGLWCSGLSKVPVAIGGPDLNPVVFLGLFVNVLSEGIAANVGLEDSFPGGTDARRLQESSGSLRHLGGGGGGGSVDWCTPGGYHIKEYKAECEDYHDRIRATTIFCVALSSAIMGCLYFILGKYKVTRFVSYVPTSVQEAFLSCIGFKVFKYALLFTNYQPLQFIPAAIIGVSLYFLKAMHIGNPAIMIPTLVLVPLGIFHLVVFAAGLDLDSMRVSGTTDNWMFPELTHANFWELWTGSYGKYDKIDFKAWTKTLPDLASMIVVCLIDCLLKISSTESKLPVKVEKDYEVKLHGMGNLLTTLTGSSVGYMQLKFNVINFGVMGNVTDRRGGVVYSLLCGACFFGTIGHFNYLPRFFLGILLFLAGSGFVAENLWGSRKHLSFAEWMEILAILFIFIFTGSLVAAVLAGVLLTSISLIMKYARISCIAGKPLKGGQIASCVRGNPLLERQLRHFANSWFVVVRLKGFIFFASAQSLCTKLTKLIEERKNEQPFKRLHYIILDLELLDGMDASAGKSIRKLRADAQKMHCKLLWSHANPKVAEDLLNKEMLSSVDHAFHSLDASILYIEYAILEYQKKVQMKWLEVDRMFKLQHNLARFEHEQDPWSSVLLKFTARRGCPWQYVEHITLDQCCTILWGPGETEQGLYLIHSGRVALFTDMPDESKEQTWSAPIAVYPHGWFLNREFVVGMPAKCYAVAIDSGEALYWSQESWWQMFAERPNMAAEIWRAVAAQQETDTQRVEKLLEIGSMHAEDNEEEEDGYRLEAYKDPNADAAEDEAAKQKISSAEAEASVSAAYDPQARADLPEQLKTLIDALDVADALGTYGCYLPYISNLTFLPPMPKSIKDDLEIAFNTYSVPYLGAKVVTADHTMAALAYAGIPRAALAHSDHEFFTRDEFMRLGHGASMARLPSELAMKLQEELAKQIKKHHWEKPLHADQISYVLCKIFHDSLTPELAQGLMDEAGPECDSDEAMFTSICSRLIRWHEQYYIFLMALRKAAAIHEDEKDAHHVFTTEALVKLTGADEVHCSEMLWACDWPRRGNAGNKFDGVRHIYDIALCILTQISAPTGNMHPPPVMTPDEVPNTSEELEASIAAKRAEKGDQDESPGDVADLMLNFSSLAAGGFDAKQYKIEFPFQVNMEEREIEFAESLDGSNSTESALKLEDMSCRQRLHQLLENPTSSKLANWWSIIMGAFIMFSVFTLFLQPVIQHGKEDDEISDTEKMVWKVIEGFLSGLFTLEYLLRLSVANAMGTQTTFRFMITPEHICDIAAILPFYIDVLLDAQAQHLRLGRTARMVRIIRLLRLARLGRLARLAKRNAIFAPISVCLLVIWFIYMKSTLSEKK